MNYILAQKRTRTENANR